MFNPFNRKYMKQPKWKQRGTENTAPTSKHSFSIEMKSKDNVKISMSSERDGEVIFEGYLGEIIQIELVEGIMLQISGENGIFRLDISEVELGHWLNRKSKS